MEFDVRALGVRYDEKTMEAQNQICTSKCACNNKGMKGCDEATGFCICHEQFIGPDCGQCKKGYTLDPNTLECHQSLRCV